MSKRKRTFLICDLCEAEFESGVDHQMISGIGTINNPERPTVITLNPARDCHEKHICHTCVKAIKLDEVFVSNKILNQPPKGCNMQEQQINNAVLQEIIEYAKDKLTAKYGYCGLAIGETMAMLNSDDKNGNDIKINIKLEAE